MQIHSYILLTKSGHPIYNIDFTNRLKNTEISLLTSFFSAIIQFSEKVVKQDINVIEAGAFRFYIEKTLFNGKELINIIIADNSVSILLLKDRMELIKEYVLENETIQHCMNSNQAAECQELGDKLKDFSNLSIDEEVIKLNDAISKIKEKLSAIDASNAALFSLSGDIFYSNFSKELLDESINEIETMSKEINNLKQLPKIIKQQGDIIKFYIALNSRKINEPVIVAVIFKYGVNLGMADYSMEELIKEIEPLI